MNLEEKYPGVSERVKALITDGVVLIIFMIGFTYLFSIIDNVPKNVRMYAFLFIFIFYDPLFTSIFGGTIGHLANGLRVRRIKDQTKKIIFPFAIVRFIFKSLLGFISLLTISGNKKNQAIHDIIAQSIVIYKR